MEAKDPCRQFQLVEIKGLVVFTLELGLARTRVEF